MKSERKDIRLVKVGLDNLGDLVDLEPNKSQYEFVADNCYSLAEAYANITNSRYAQPFGIYNGEKPVGFMMIGYNIADEEDDPEKFPLLVNNYLIWRFMIDKKYQHKGYGKEALKKALEFLRTKPDGDAEYITLSYERTNVVAKNLYASLGFYEPEEFAPFYEEEDEITAILKIK